MFALTAHGANGRGRGTGLQQAEPRAFAHSRKIGQSPVPPMVGALEFTRINIELTILPQKIEERWICADSAAKRQ